MKIEIDVTAEEIKAIGDEVRSLEAQRLLCMEPFSTIIARLLSMYDSPPPRSGPTMPD